MNYIVLDADRFIKYETVREAAQLLSKSKLIAEMNHHLETLANIPLPMTDEELLAWAKEHHPQMDYSTQREFLNNRISEIQADLAQVE